MPHFLIKELSWEHRGIPLFLRLIIQNQNSRALVRGKFTSRNTVSCSRVRNDIYTDL